MSLNNFFFLNKKFRTFLDFSFPLSAYLTNDNLKTSNTFYVINLSMVLAEVHLHKPFAFLASYTSLLSLFPAYETLKIRC